MIVLNEPLEGDIWLFHGTSKDVAERIISEGWNPPDPREAVLDMGVAHGVPAEDLLWGFTELGADRHERSEASCTNSWRLAAEYARRGPEYLYHASAGLEMARQRVDHWVEPSRPAPIAAVFIARVAHEVLVRLGNGEPVTTYLPDFDPRGDLLSDIFRGAQHEVLLPGAVLADHLAAVDWIRTDCDCTGAMVFPSPPGVDPRQRCSSCLLSEAAL